MQKFYILQKFISFGDEYHIYDEKENEVYYAKEKIISIAVKVKIYRNIDDEVIYTIKKKVLRILPKYVLKRKREKIASIKKRLAFFKHRFIVHSKFGTLQINGDLYSRNINIMLNEETKAKVTKVVMPFGDAYEVTIFSDEKEDIEFYLALVIMIDNSLYNSKGLID